VAGSGPGGRIMRADLQTAAARQALADAADTTEKKVNGVRRLIAERNSEANHCACT
jgi:pyruvate/2-oxoglutarate dehydrogenase complex dihydrolipoamide acyltransferase (E2) component